MNRKKFIKASITGVAAMTTLSDFRNFTDDLREQDQKMPVLFVGHGSPMNAIEDNEFSRRWKQMGKELPTPTAVLIVSAHWLTRGTHITSMTSPKTIHDFGGFPKELHEATYRAPGNPELARFTASLFKSTSVGLDHDWGLDHGAWSVAMQMFPEAKVPVLQLSIDYHKEPAYHYQLAKELSSLRKKGVLILGSGNMVHNLGMMRIPGNDFNNFNSENGYDWAFEMNAIFKDKIMNRDHLALLKYEGLHKDAKLAVPTPDHYYPLLYALALQDHKDEVSFFNDKVIGGAFTMTSVKIG
jgi:4,5-DOPA dioxygenase extradiol